jgi:SAM-dependent methyltransferase
MKESHSQSPDTWTNFWKGRTPYKGLSLKDCYGERPYVLKYVPRKGKVLEAGSGLGRVVFYLERLGIDILGLDFSKRDLCQCRVFSRKHRIDHKRFIYGNILSLPFDDNSLSGYLSFGVVEHFIEGPQKPLKEAFRVLKPGGIIIITTPNRFAFHWLYGSLKSKIKNHIKKLFYIFKGKKYVEPQKEFWQYWYSKDQLRDFTEEQGFKTIISENFGLKNAMDWLIRSPEFIFLKTITPLVMKVTEFFDRLFIRNFSAHSIVVAYKPGNNLHCFISNSEIGSDSTEEFDLPISSTLRKKLSPRILERYKNNKRPFFAKRQNNIGREVVPNSNNQECFYCNKDYSEDKIIDFCFSRCVCHKCIKNPVINLEVTNFYLKEEWFPQS